MGSNPIVGFFLVPFSAPPEGKQQGACMNFRRAIVAATSVLAFGAVGTVGAHAATLGYYTAPYPPGPNALHLTFNAAQGQANAVAVRGYSSSTTGRTIT